jgi:universal stress protein A
MAIYNNILLAVDFAPDSEQVVQRAQAMARQEQAQLSLVHVVEYMPMDMTNELTLPPEVELDQELNALAVRRLQELGGRIGVSTEHQHVLQGSTRSEVLRLAEELQADLIIIGSHGRHGIQLLLGSTANAVLHGAPCDVLAVRIQEQE